MEHFFLDVGMWVSAVLCIIFIFRSYKKGTLLGKTLSRVLIMMLLSVVAYAVNYHSTDERVMFFAVSTCHASYDWMLFFMMCFTFEFVGRTAGKFIKFFYIVLCALDSAALMTSPINHFSFTYAIREGNFNNVALVEPKAFFAVHMVVGTSMIVIIMALLAKGIIENSRYYRLRYEIVGLVCIFTMFFVLFFIYDNYSVLDLSKLFMGIAAVLLNVASFDFQPVRLMRNLQTYVDENMSDATVIFDNKGNILKINAKAKNLLSEDIRKSKEALMSALELEEDSERVIKSINDRTFEVVYKPEYDSKNLYVGCTFIFYDVTESLKRLEREHKAATIDSLTGCYNRAGFMESVDAFIEKNKIDGGYAVMVSGIRDFKGINGLYGTRAGDRVLKEIARHFTEYSYSFPMLYGRTAEGKFTCILPFDSLDRVVNELSHIQIPLEDEMAVNVNLCHGFVVMTDMTKPVEYYYEIALLALAECKKNVSNSVLEYSSAMAQEQRRTQTLIAEMHEAVEKDEFYIELQPQVDLKTNKVSGAEALVRWMHPTLGKIPPQEFIPLFEDNGFVSKVDRYVWEKAAETLKRFNDEGSYDGPISVNVSRVDVLSLNVVEEMENIIKKYDIPPEKLHIEITESACIGDKETLIAMMDGLRERGFVVEI
ncbi:MAG: EAL domain-containing protein, partial [Lachnospiraceae bacterium]|nr:EAL domain-containing protein [Lachnospiraceae bacterium]